MILSDAQRQFLKEVRFAVVSTIDAQGLPHQTVMWYALEGDELLLSTPHDSLKHKHLTRDPRISVCVEDHYTYVTLTGTVTLDEDPGGARAGYQRLQRRYQQTLVPMLAGFILRRGVAWVKRLLRPRTAGQASDSRVQDLLSRERVTLHMNIEKVQSSGLT
jgi:PPOX class probable F420-dependent enzyme